MVVSAQLKEKLPQPKVTAAYAVAATANKENATVATPRAGQVTEPPLKKLRQSSSNSPSSSPSIAESPTLDSRKDVIIPSKDDTLIEPFLTSMCATMCSQIYEAESIKDFNLSTAENPIEVIKFDDHGDLAATTPPFAVAVAGETMVLAWRGSKTLMDWINDIAFSPVVSSRWSKVGKSIRVTGSYCSLIENELSIHEEWLIKEIKSRNISQIVLSGHSLAGGMAQVAHVFLEGQLQQESSPWGPLKDKVVCRSVAFCAPMTIVNVDRSDSQSHDFLMNIARNSSNIVFGADVVPHGYGDLEFIDKAIDAVIPDIAKGIPLNGAIKWLANAKKRLEDLYDNVTKKESVIALLDVMDEFHQVGNIIYYSDVTAEPVILGDYDATGKENSFRDYPIQMPEADRDGSVSQKLVDAHGAILKALAYNTTNDK